MAACNQTLPSESQLLNNMAKRRRRLQQWYGTRKVNSPLDGVLDQCRVITPTPTPTSLLPCTIYLQGRCPFKGLSLEQPELEPGLLNLESSTLTINVFIVRAEFWWYMTTNHERFLLVDD